MTSDRQSKTPDALGVRDTHGDTHHVAIQSPSNREDSTMFDVDRQTIEAAAAQLGITPEEVEAQLKTAGVTAPPEAPKVPLAVTLAVGLANAVSKTEAAAKAAKEAATGFKAQFTAAYREKRPAAVKTVEAKNVNPEELAAAIAKIQQGQ